MAKTRLGTTYEALSGRLGNTVASNEQDGTTLRAHNPLSRQPFTPVQLQREAAFTKANKVWTTIGIPAATAWRDWGRTQKVRNELTGKFRSREGKDCFTGLYAKLLQMNPAAAIPTPPAEAMPVETLSVSVSIGTGGSIWTSTGTNVEGITTELMAQRIPSEVALPSKEYATQGFVAFERAGQTVTLPLAPGYWSFGYQFVETSSGRVEGFTALGTHKVTLALVQGGSDASAGRTAKKAA